MQEHIPGTSHCLPMNTSSVLGAAGVGGGWGGVGGEGVGGALSQGFVAASQEGRRGP